MTGTARFRDDHAVCDGCGVSAPRADMAGLWLNAPLGLCFVRVHRVRECAIAARDARGGGKFRPGVEDA